MLGMLGLDGVGQHIGRQQARDHFDVERRIPLATTVAPQRLQPAVQHIGTLPSKIAGQKIEQFFEIGIQRRMAALLNAEFGAHHHRLGRGDHRHHLLERRERHVGGSGETRDGDFEQGELDRLETAGVLAQEILIDHVLADQHRQQRREQIGVRTGAHGDMQIGLLGGFAAPRIDDDELARRILGQRVQFLARVGETMREPGIGAEHQQQIAMLDVFRAMAALRAEQMTVDPEVAGLLLRQGIEDMARTETAQEGGGVGAAGMIALPAAAIERERLRAMGGDHLTQPRSDLADGGFPGNRFVATVSATAQRRGQAVMMMHIARNALGLIA